MLRAQIVLFAANGEEAATIASWLGISVNTASKWRKRFVEEGLKGLADRKRSGRPKTFGASVVAEVTAVACELLRDLDRREDLDPGALSLPPEPSSRKSAASSRRARIRAQGCAQLPRRPQRPCSHRGQA